MPEKEVIKEVVRDPKSTIVMLEFALGLLGALYTILMWRVFKSVPQSVFDKIIKDMEGRFDKKVDDLKTDLTDDTKVLKKDLKAQITEYKEDGKKDINEVKGICKDIFNTMEKRHGGK